MEVEFTPDVEARLAQLASKEGVNATKVVQEVVARYFAEQDRFVDDVTLGEEQLERNEFLTHEQVGQRLSRFLKT